MSVLLPSGAVSRPLERSDPLELDRRDPLASLRERFDLPEGLTYLGGHSLGPLPRTMVTRAGGLIEEEWGRDLVAAWNRRDWLELPERVGARIAPLVGAGADEVIAADSVSLNLFKLLGALMVKARGRGVVVADKGNFPTDLYMAQGLARLLEGAGATLRLTAPEDFESALGSGVAVATVSHVDFRTGRRRDLRALTATARACGVPLVWDLSHSAGAVALQLNEDGVEYAVGCGYKYLNGGPGAPGFLYVAREFQDALESPLTGWMGHVSPFDFDTHYRPGPGMRRFLTGTPPILALAALEEGLRTFEGVEMAELRGKSGALGDLFLRLAAERLAEFGVIPASPADAGQRGAQVSLRHPEGDALIQALNARGVVGDFRGPDLMRFGLAPLYVRYVDVWNAVEMLRLVLVNEKHREDRFRQHRRVP